MAEAKVFWIVFWGKLRQSFAAPDRALSSSLVAIGLLLLVVGLIWFSALSINKSTAQIIIYIVALFELLLGLRVGLLRIGYRGDEYMISTSSRFWRRAINYLVPAIVLPLPIILAIVANIPGLNWAGIAIAKTLLLNALMFFGLGASWGIVIRRLSKQLPVRIFLLVMSVIAVFATVNTGWLIFSPELLFSASYSTILTVLIFELSVIVLSVTLIELLLGSIALTNRNFGRYYPLLLSTHLSGSGPGSSSFYLTAKKIFRDSLVHRRLAAVVFVFIVTVGLIYNYANLLEPTSVSGLILSLFAIFGGSLVFIISHNTPPQTAYYKDGGDILRSHSSKIAAGRFLGGLLWTIVSASILWGVIDLTFGASQWIAVMAVAVFTQFVLANGWSQKLIESHHQTLSTLTVFGMIVLIGLVPALLWGAANVNQIIFIQLIWLILTVILMRLTNTAGWRSRYA